MQPERNGPMKYKVTVLTPLLVGDGRELAPVDYMVWKDQINVLDQTRIFKLLARGPRLEGYLTQLRKATTLDFASWGGFAQNFSQRRIPFEHAESKGVWNASSTENLFIQTFAADHRGPYLPASSLKGSLRTGLVFSRWNAATLERASAGIENDRVSRRLAESAEAAAGASQVRVLAAADSAPVPITAFRIYVIRVASIDTKLGKPQLVWKVAGRGSVSAARVSDATASFAEMAVPGTAFSGGWDERKFLETTEATRALGWRTPPNVELLTGAANDFASAQLALHAAYAEVTGLGALAQTIDSLQKQLEAVRNQPLSCLLCIGWGSGFLSKAGFHGTDSPAYQKLLKLVPAIGRSLREGTPFPKTRRVVFQGGKPATLPGWVRLDLAG